MQLPLRIYRTHLPYPTADQSSMVSKFTAAMAKMAVLGQDTKTLVDCSEVIPVPAKALSQVAHLPAGKSLSDIEGSCQATPFPTISADPGALLQSHLYRAVCMDIGLTTIPSE